MKNNPHELAAWLALLHTPKLGPTTALKILEFFSSPVELLAASRQTLLASGLAVELIQHLLNPNWGLIEKSLAWSQIEGNDIITWQDAIYPQCLKETIGAPLMLFVRGDPQILVAPQLAIVGSRHPTPTGIDIAYQFSEYLSRQGFTITSGLALGIDAAAHRGALMGKGKTIAVMGTGAEQIYPARHQALARQILDQGGVLVSEFPPGTLPKAEHFPRRNRIISGLSLGTLVVEAAIKSGSLITAKYALEQGREVFAVPGSIYNPLARGCHALLKQGAKLVETADDVLEEFSIKQLLSQGESGQRSGNGELAQCSAKLPPYLPSRSFGPMEERILCDASESIRLDSLAAKLVECIGFETTAVDTVIERSGLGADIVSSRLMMLELQGVILAVPGGYIRKTA